MYKTDDLRQVGGRNHHAPLLLQFAQHSAGDGCPLQGFGSSSQFVQQHQASGAGLAEDGGNPRGMGRKGGVALFDGLLVADIHQQHIQKREG